MNQRVDEREWIQFQWPCLLALLGGEAKVNALAFDTGAFVRRRELRSPAEVLQLILTWAVAERSLRETAALAAQAGMADVSDVALLKRFTRAGKWLGSLLAERLSVQPAPKAVASRVRVLDATAVSARGSRGTDRRLHMSIDLRSSRITSLELTDARGVETYQRHTFSPGEIVIADRGYASRKGLAHVSDSGAYFLVRMPWGAIPLENSDGTSFDLLGALGSLSEAEAGTFDVQFRSPAGKTIPCRLVAIRKSEAAAALARRKALADSRRHGAKVIDVRTLEAAAYVIVLTNAPSALTRERARTVSAAVANRDEVQNPQVSAPPRQRSDAEWRPAKRLSRRQAARGTPHRRPRRVGRIFFPLGISHRERSARGGSRGYCLT
jgi:hypothetical protein